MRVARAMSQSQPVMIRLLSASVAVANRAGQVIRDVLSSGKLGVVQKGYDDPQTEADRRAERCIVATLSSRFPGVKIVGEESLVPSEEDRRVAVVEDSREVLKEHCPDELASVQEEDVVVWVDPLDGTKEFTNGFIEDVTLLIGISVGGKAMAGVIHQPFYGGGQSGSPGASPSPPGPALGRTVWGMRGLGVRGLLPQPPPPPDAMRLVVTRSHYSEVVDQTVKTLQPSEVIRAGGAGNKILMVLEGKADTYIYPKLGTKKWDTCAGDALVHAVGGLLTDVHGKPLSYEPDPSKYPNREGVIVTTNTKLHEEIVKKMPTSVRNALL